MEEAYYFSNRNERRGRHRRKLAEKKENFTRNVATEVNREKKRVKKERLRHQIRIKKFHYKRRESMHTHLPGKPSVEQNVDIYHDDNSTVNDDDIEAEIPSAESLGLKDGPMYERLRSIIEGADITPEDYDLLLLLDNNNAKNTMDSNKISEISLVVLDDGDDAAFFRSWESSFCDICLESFKELPKGTEVRHLPCNHVFCKKCIDHWFSEVSTKCPNLSCYWQKEKTTDY